ncbi:MAG: hypothetical protein CL748_02315 [Chloroflexi bacterium]|nr:hypothetical protein [Chloroflexota bacterium]
MKRKLILAFTAGLLGALSIVGATFANEGENKKDNFQARVAELLGIEHETYSAAIKTAKEEFKLVEQEERLEDLKEKLSAAVSEGKITEDEANDKLESITAIHDWINSEPEAMELLKEAKKSVEMKEISIDEILSILVSEGSITQEESDNITVWMDSKPEDMEYIKDKKSKGKMKGKKDKSRMKGKSEPRATEVSNKNIEIRLAEAVTSGEITEKQAEIKLVQINEKKNCAEKKSLNSANEENISREQIKMMIFNAIENGEINDYQAKEKLSQLVSK